MEGAHRYLRVTALTVLTLSSLTFSRMSASVEVTVMPTFCLCSCVGVGRQGDGLVPGPSVHKLPPLPLVHPAVPCRCRRWLRARWSARVRSLSAFVGSPAACGLRLLRHQSACCSGLGFLGLLLTLVVPLLPLLIGLGRLSAYTAFLGRDLLPPLVLPLLHHHQVVEVLSAVGPHVLLGLVHGGDLVALGCLPGASALRVEAGPPGCRCCSVEGC